MDVSNIENKYGSLIIPSGKKPAVIKDVGDIILGGDLCRSNTATACQSQQIIDLFGTG
ncbi:MAG: hypothetical protein IJW35_04515 [Lentisphaeria bacterium]|nr:hypothetical protein [Lentisphaeria bacterium]